MSDPRDAEMARLRAENERLRNALAAARAMAQRRAGEHADMALAGEPSHARRREGMGAAFTEMAHAIQHLHQQAVLGGALAARQFGMADT